MKFRIAALLLLAASAAFGQSTPPGTGPTGAPLAVQAPPFGARRMARPATSTSNQSDLHKRVEDMQSTVSKMQTLVKQMRAKAAKSGTTKDPVVKANLDLWELMIGHLDKQLEELKVAAATHDEWEARRAAMYKQADANAAARAKSEQAAFEAQIKQNANATPAAAPATTPAPSASGQSSPAPSPASTSTPN